MVVTKEYESCDDEDQQVYKKENETFYHKGVVITFEGRREKELVIVTPKYRHEVYIMASGGNSQALTFDNSCGKEEKITPPSAKPLQCFFQAGLPIR